MRSATPGTKQDGFTLVELLIALAITGILAAVAVPLYTSYMESSRTKVAETNLQTLKLAEIAYFYEHNEYKDGTYDPAGGTNTLDVDTLGWKPDQDGNKFSYTVTDDPCGDINDCFTITVTGFDGAVTVTDTSD